jgi:hypothetical protein
MIFFQLESFELTSPLNLHISICTEQVKDKCGVWNAIYCICRYLKLGFNLNFWRESSFSAHDLNMTHARIKFIYRTACPGLRLEDFIKSTNCTAPEREARLCCAGALNL